MNNKYKPFSKYPYVEKDLAFVVDEDILSENILNTIDEHLGKYDSGRVYADKDVTVETKRLGLSPGITTLLNDASMPWIHLFYFNNWNTTKL